MAGDGGTLIVRAVGKRRKWRARARSPALPPDDGPALPEAQLIGGWACAPLAVRGQSRLEDQKPGSRGILYGFHRVAKAGMGC